MGVIYQTKWAAEGFFQKLPDLLQPRILAEGYYLRDSDEGKQVYGRTATPREPRFRIRLGGHTWDDVMGCMILRVGYVLTPGKTAVVFTWETSPTMSVTTRVADKINKWLRGHAKAFFDYLNQWYAEVRRQLDEK